jgi:hypothetical protein
VSSRVKLGKSVNLVDSRRTSIATPNLNGLIAAERVRNVQSINIASAVLYAVANQFRVAKAKQGIERHGLPLSLSMDHS